MVYLYDLELPYFQLRMSSDVTERASIMVKYWENKDRLFYNIWAPALKIARNKDSNKETNQLEEFKKFINTLFTREIDY